MVRIESGLRINSSHKIRRDGSAQVTDILWENMQATTSAAYLTRVALPWHRLCRILFVTSTLTVESWWSLLMPWEEGMEGIILTYEWPTQRGRVVGNTSLLLKEGLNTLSNLPLTTVTC